MGLQLDIYGEALSAIYAADGNDGIEIDYDGWTHLARTLGWLCEHWDQAEEGIWETRGGRQDFVYGRINSWTALDRAVRIAADHSLPGDLARWTTERDRIYWQVMDRGWNGQRRAFVQHYDTQVLDAALLRMVQVGFVTPRDRRWLSTLDARDTELVLDSLVYRHNPEASPDGLRGSEGTFSLCTFWVCGCARPGRPTGPGRAHLREDAHLRQPPRALFRGDQPDRRAAWQLPPGLHPPCADQRRPHPDERLDRRADG